MDRVRASRISRPRLTGYLAMGAAASICVWLVATHGGGSGLKTVRIGPSSSANAAATTTKGSAPSLLGTAALAARSRALGHPVYWAGPDAGARYDLTRDVSGNAVVRYVAPASESETLRVATIPYANAYAATKELAAKPGSSSQSLPNGSLVYYREDRPSTYVVFPNVDDVIEVDAPSPAHARQVALAGRIRPINH
jgi:hypothetical protein